MGRQDKLHDKKGHNRFVSRSEKKSEHAKKELNAVRNSEKLIEQNRPPKFKHKSKKKRY